MESNSNELELDLPKVEEDGQEFYTINIDEEFKSKFKERRNILAIKVKKKETNNLIKQLSNIVFRAKLVNPVESADNDHNLIKTNLPNEDDLKKVLTDNELNLDEHPIINSFVEEGYDQMSTNQVLRRILPNNLNEIPKSFEAIGTVAHLNLRESSLPFKYVIGKKNPGIKTVINKKGKIDNVFRTYEIEVLAGEENFIVTHKEGKCLFNFDVRKVYWCSRLQAERDRVLKLFKKGEVLCDAFCGVGPLAIRAAKVGLTVLANDLNPHSYEYITINQKLNNIKNITCFNMDAREFIRAVIGRAKLIKDDEENFDGKFPEDVKVDHFYMNLPKDAIEFLDVFVGLFKNTNKEIYSKDSLPTVHIYGFSNAVDPKQELTERIGKAMNISADLIIPHISVFHNVRDISPKKHVFCISFKIPPEVAYQ